MRRRTYLIQVRVTACSRQWVFRSVIHLVYMFDSVWRWHREQSVYIYLFSCSYIYIFSVCLLLTIHISSRRDSQFAIHDVIVLYCFVMTKVIDDSFFLLNQRKVKRSLISSSCQLKAPLPSPLLSFFLHQFKYYSTTVGANGGDHIGDLAT